VNEAPAGFPPRNVGNFSTKEHCTGRSKRIAQINELAEAGDLSRETVMQIS